jgi:pimeloyl-ACP methyl ester carboxylesterase
MSRPVLLIHGAFAGAWMFRDLGRKLADAGYTVHAPDLPFHGRKKPEAPAMALGMLGVRDYLSDMKARLDRFDQPPIVIGHSLGGLLAQQLAAEGLIKAAVLLAPVAPWGVLPSTSHEVMTAFGLMQVGPLWGRPIWPDYTAARYSMNLIPEETRRATYDQLGPESGRVVFETLQWGLDPTHASAVDARKVACPILCAVGDKDVICPPGTVRSVAYRYRRFAQFEVLPDLSHFMLGEPKEAELTELIFTWLRDNHLGP